MCTYDDYTTLITYNYINSEWIPTEKQISDVLQKQYPLEYWRSFYLSKKNYSKYYSWEDNSWFETNETIVDDGLISTRSWNKDAEGVVSGSGQDYKLNANHNMTYKVNYTCTNGEFVPTDKYEVTDSDKLGNILSDIYYTYSDGEFIPTSKYINTYYTNGIKESSKGYQFIDNNWVLTSEEYFDERNNCILYWYQTYENNSITYGYKSIHEYDSKNNKTKYIRYDWQDNNWVETESYQINNIYDSEGRLKEVDWNVKDNTGNWVTEKKDIYEYEIISYLPDLYSVIKYENYNYYSKQCTNIPTSKFICQPLSKDEYGMVNGEWERFQVLYTLDYDSSTSSWDGNAYFTENIVDGPTYDFYMWCNIGDGQIALYCHSHSERHDDEYLSWNKINAAGWCQPTSEMVLESYEHSKIYRDSNLTSEDVLCDYCGNIILYNASYNPDGDEISRTTYYYSEFTPADITGINVEHLKTDEIYNLNGQKISSSVKGIQIRNGKKHICN